MSTDPTGTPPTRAPGASACEIYREVITDALAHGRNAMAIWQDLVDDHGFSAKYASVRRFVLKLRGAAPPRRASSLQLALVRRPRSTKAGGRWCATRSPASTAGSGSSCSRWAIRGKAVRLLTWRPSAQIWAELHERAFRRLGGTVKVIVLDNLGEDMLTPDIYDPALNPLYRDVLAHYGVTVRIPPIVISPSTPS